jgi:hypothetical protein
MLENLRCELETEEAQIVLSEEGFDLWNGHPTSGNETADRDIRWC